MEKCKVLEYGRFTITNPYKNGEHNGVDVTDINENGIHLLCFITAHTAGQVIAVRTDSTGFEPGGSYGNYMKILHNNGYATLYAHLAPNTVRLKVGDSVKAGDLLGYMGNTGTSYGGHLHFEVWNGATRIDPTPYLCANLPAPADGFKVGQLVNVTFGAKIYGKDEYFKDEVYSTIHTVKEINGSRVVLYSPEYGLNPVNIKDITHYSNSNTLKVGDAIKLLSNRDIAGTYLNMPYLDSVPLIISDIYDNTAYIKRADAPWIECVMYLKDIKKI